MGNYAVMLTLTSTYVTYLGFIKNSLSNGNLTYFLKNTK